jgi:hypothetical protein
MGRLVHTGLGSSSLVAHVLPNPPAPHVNSFVLGPAIINTHGRPWTTDGRNAPRTTENITEQDYVAFFHQFLGFTNTPALAPFANVQRRCQRYFMGGDGAWDHINSCIHQTRAHEHVLRALERICHAAGLPPITSGCSRVRAAAAPILKSATSAWRKSLIC